MSGQDVSGISFAYIVAFARGTRTFRGDQLARLCQTLEGAAGILPRKGDKRGEVRAWKLACAMNHAKVKNLAEHLAARVHEILRPAEGWLEVAERLELIAEQSLGEAISADVLVSVVCTGWDHDVPQQMLNAYGAEVVKRFYTAVAAWGDAADASTLEMLRARDKALGAAAAMLEAPCSVPGLVLVKWAKIPGALHGGYLRDLAWMFEDVAPEMENMAEAPLTNIAMVCHEVNRAYCQAIGDMSQTDWVHAPEWQRTSAINGVRLHLCNRAVTPAQSHESWLAEKVTAGWKYGPVKDAEKKEHPCCVPYDDLPVAQKAKDAIFGAIVRAMTNNGSVSVDVQGG